MSNIAAFLPMALVAVGQTYVVLASDIDLSAGAIVSLVNVVVVSIIEGMGGTRRIDRDRARELVSRLGVACGAINGLCVAVLRLQPIVTTFATGIVFSGFALWVLPEAGKQVPPVVYTAYAGSGARRTHGHLDPRGRGRVRRRDRPLALLSGACVRPAATYRPPIRPALPVAARAHCVPMPSPACSRRSRASRWSGETASGDPLIGGALTLSSVTAVVLGGTALSLAVSAAWRAASSARSSSGLISNVIFFAQLPFEWQGLVQGVIILLALAGGVVMARGRTD